MSDLPAKTNTDPSTDLPENDLYTHVDYLGRLGETPEEKAHREALNDAGRRLHELQRGNNQERRARKENPSNFDNRYRTPFDPAED